MSYLDIDLKVRNINDVPDFERGFCSCIEMLDSIAKNIRKAERELDKEGVCYCHSDGLCYSFEEDLDKKVKGTIIPLLIHRDFEGYDDFLFGFFVALSEIISKHSGGCFVKIEKVFKKNISSGLRLLFEHNNINLKGLRKSNYVIAGYALNHLENIEKEIKGRLLSLGCCYGYKLNIVLYS